GDQSRANSRRQSQGGGHRPRQRADGRTRNQPGGSPVRALGNVWLVRLCDHQPSPSRHINNAARERCAAWLLTLSPATVDRLGPLVLESLSRGGRKVAADFLEDHGAPRNWLRLLWAEKK